jgi:hypothetical protein
MRLWRSPHEILFRLRQELRNLSLAALPPAFPEVPQAPLWPMPGGAIELLQRSPAAEKLVAAAEEVLAHRFPVFGLTLETGPEIEWRRDYLHGRISPLCYFRRVPYLNFAAVGDHKAVWELSRHQHLVLLAQAFRLTGRAAFRDEIVAQLESWWRQNPFQSGINWTSALEAAFRAWSWTWLDALIGSRLPAGFRARLLRWLGLHGCHIEANLSVYFSPNTHLLGEAMVLHALGALYPEWPRAARWRRLGEHWMLHELDRQLPPDGVHFEQSSYYHLYALDMFLAHFLLAGRPAEFVPGLFAMAEFLDHLLGAGRTLPLLGDDDGGRLFHPYGPRREFACATLATCGVLFRRPEWIRDPADLLEQAVWWLGAEAVESAAPAAPAARSSRLFGASGLAVLACGDAQVIVDTGPFGPWGAGHSHSDTLQVLVRRGSEELLIDPGTFTYVADSAARDQFRGSAAHNTVRAGELDQADPVHAFRWRGKPEVERTAFTTSPDSDFVDACCRYRGFLHRRRVLWRKPCWLLIFDDISGPQGEHTVEQFWHPGVPVEPWEGGFRLGRDAWLWLSDPGEILEGWRSEAFAQRAPAPVLRVRRRGPLPQRFAAAVQLGGRPDLAQAFRLWTAS